MRALITGASSGIGRDIARYLSKLGIDLVLVARRYDRLQELKETLDVNVEIICMDISSIENCIELYKQAKDIDILINNAGFGVFGEFSRTDLIEEINLINTNICAVHTLTKLYISDMKEKNSGYILNVGSIGGFLPGPLMATYYSSKAYIVKLTQSIYEELKQAKSNVSISCLCPGPVYTEFNEKAGVKFSIQSLSSEYVAKYAIDKMFKNKLIIIPGISIKLIHFFSKITPDKILSKITYRMQKRKDSEN